MPLLRLLDAALVVVTLYPVVILYVAGRWSEHYTALSGVAFILTLLVFHYADVYQPWRERSFVNELSVIATAWLVEIGLLMFLLFVFKRGGIYSRVALLAWFGIVPVVLFTVHVALRKVLRVVRSGGGNLRRAVIAGAGELGLSLARHIEAAPWTGVRVVGFFDDHKTTVVPDAMEQPEKAVLGTISELPDYLARNEVDFVYIALPMRAEDKIHHILQNCRTLGARLYLVPDLYAFQLFNARLERLGSMLLLGFNPESGRKRLFDVVFSALVLVCSLPLTLPVALLIKLGDGGPIFYGHRRITVSGREFRCLKFRTMCVEADRRLAGILERDPAARREWERTFKLKDDPRVTWLGRFLRRTSLDELPQFINVLRGEMSVVGARPVVHRELCDYYREHGGIYCSIKPGVTGPWQAGKRSDTEDYQERVRLDTWYAVNRNFWLDLKIIGLTVLKVLRGGGAY